MNSWLRVTPVLLDADVDRRRPADDHHLVRLDALGEQLGVDADGAVEAQGDAAAAVGLVPVALEPEV